jgi:hypothetical protein
MLLQVTLKRSLISKKSISVFFAVLALLVQPIVSLNVPVVFAAGITVAPSSLSVANASTGTSAVDTRGYQSLKVSFAYNAELLDNNDRLDFGWKQTGGANQPLGSIVGKNESNGANSAATQVDETGVYTDIQLPQAADNQQIQLYFMNTGGTGSDDTVSITNIAVSGSVIPSVDTTVPSTPTVSLASGTYTSSQTVSLAASDNSGSVTIRYTIDGTQPSISTGILYTSPITVASSTTLKAVAYDAANNVSELMSETYTINTPTPLPPQQTVTVRPTSMAGWVNGDTRPGGSYGFVNDVSSPLPSGALQIRTDSTTAAKVQLGRLADMRLDELKKLSYSTKQFSANVPDGNASIQLAVYLDGSSAASYTNLVYEPYWNGNVQPNVWQTWDAFSGKFWSSQSYGALQAGGGGAPFYTISDVLNSFPNAKIIGYAISAGSNNPNYQINVDGVHIASDQSNILYNFEQNLPPAAPTGLNWKNSAGIEVTVTKDQNGTATWQASMSDDVTGYIYKYWNDIPGNQYKETTPYEVSLSGTSLAGSFNQGEGTHYFCVVAVDAAGKESACSEAASIVYDVTPAKQPVVTYVKNSTATDSPVTVTMTFTENMQTPDGWATTDNKSFTKQFKSNEQNTVNYLDRASNVTTVAYKVEGISTNPIDGETPDNETPESQPSTPPVSEDNSIISPVAGQLSTIAGLNGANQTGRGVFGTSLTPDSVATENDDNGQVLGTRDNKSTNKVAAISPSEQGWKIFGFAWYWWLLIIAAIAAIWWVIAGYLRRNNEEA